jgi:hypothetical protein
MAYNGPALELKCINTIRAVSADQPEAANSGHPGAPMGCAPMVRSWNRLGLRYVEWKRIFLVLTFITLFIRLISFGTKS